MKRFLGIDYGTKRIGLAVGDDDTRVAAPLVTIEAGPGREAEVEAVLHAAVDYEPDAFVVGLPLNMDGTEGEQARLTRKFGDALAKRSGLPIHYFDERLSSHSADQMLRPAELTHQKHKARRDAVAAQVILQAFLDAEANG